MFWLEMLLAALAGAFLEWLFLRNKGVAEKAGLTARLEEVKAARDQLSQAFEALSSEALRNNNRQFLDLAESTLAKFQANACGDLEKRRAAIDELVRPLKQSLEKVDQKIHAMEVARSGAYATLTEQVKSMAESQIRLREETGKLAGALRSPAARGRWGEIQLRRVVEMAGMLEYCDFVEQQTAGTEDGRLRPDLIVRLPNGKHVVVDSKVPLKAYLESLEESDEAGRAAKLREHAGQVRKHLTKLGEKSYWAQFSACPEFAVAFLPGEIFFSAALQADPELIEHGVGKN
ncbi:MAG: DNA recombination protein RmuC, partial [Bryobacteraceae bacterium]